MTKSGQVLRRKVFHTTLGCSHLTQWKNVLPQPAIHQNSTTHVTFSKGSSNSSRFNTTKINRSVKQGENWKIICKNLKQRLYWRNEKKSNLRTLKNENENKNWPALRICHVIWIEKLPHIIDQLQQVISLACPDGAETMEVMDFGQNYHIYICHAIARAWICKITYTKASAGAFDQTITYTMPTWLCYGLTYNNK